MNLVAQEMMIIEVRHCSVRFYTHGCGTENPGCYLDKVDKMKNVVSRRHISAVASKSEGDQLTQNAGPLKEPHDVLWEAIADCWRNTQFKLGGPS